jgi:hypothetical protein
MNPRLVSFIAIAVLAACGGKKEPAPVAPAAQLGAGATPALGCFAWSPSRKAAACVTGSISNGDPELFVEYVGAGAPPGLELSKAFDAAGLAAVNEALSRDGFTQLAGNDDAVTEGKAFPVGPSASSLSILWTRTQTDPGGENQPPSHKNELVATCNGKPVSLLTLEAEGDNPTVSVRTIGAHALVSLHVHIAREGEQADQFSAAVLDTATCTVSASTK